MLGMSGLPRVPPSLPVPSVLCGLFPTASAPAALSANKTFSSPLTTLVKLTFHQRPSSSLRCWRSRAPGVLVCCPLPSYVQACFPH